MEDIMQRIHEVLREKVSPKLLEHNGDIQVESFEDGILKFRLTGACSGCPSAGITTETIIKEEIQAAIPEVRDVILLSGVSDELIAEAKRILSEVRKNENCR